ncbi:MAG: ABC transporter ATP-binding protein [Rhodospirillales bacterium]|nr:ABC transporter ATP-binding protein [Rhodospirillales bacterium]
MLEVVRKSLFFIDRSTRWQAVGITGVMIVGTALEALGIGLVFPLVEVIVDPSALGKSQWAPMIFDDIETIEHATAMFILTGLFFAAIVFKNLVLLLSFVLQGRFFAQNEAMLAHRLFSHYLHGDYRRLLTRNSSDLINNIVATTTSVYTHAIRSIITLATESILLVVVAAILLYASPLMTLSAIALMCVAISVIYLITRHRVVIWGRRAVELRQQILQRLQQGLHSIKEVRVFGREAFLLDGFKHERRELADVTAKTFVMGNVPRLWIETVTLGGIVFGICYAISLGSTTNSLFPVIALFAAAVFRLIPSFNRILMAMNALRGGTYPVLTLYADLTEGDGEAVVRHADAPMPFNDTIELRNVSFSYPESAGAAARDITLTIKHGETIGLVGPSGAGKTTLADIILGLLPTDTGSVFVDGKDITTNVRAWQLCLGYVPQTVYLSDDSLRRNVAFGEPDDKIDDERVLKVLSMAQLEQLIKELPQGLDTNVGDRGTRLSGGQRQRVGIARALYHDPEVLVLDEATSSLDSEAEFEISRAIERLGRNKTIIIVAHRLSTLRSCDRLVFMTDGRVADVGSFKSLEQNNPAFKKLLELSKF